MGRYGRGAFKLKLVLGRLRPLAEFDLPNGLSGSSIFGVVADLPADALKELELLNAALPELPASRFAVFELALVGKGDVRLAGAAAAAAITVVPPGSVGDLLLPVTFALVEGPVAPDPLADAGSN